VKVRRGLRGRCAQRMDRAERALNGTLADVSRQVPEGAVALTFDDGPHPSSTVPILDALAELDVRATFFCVGRNVRAHPDIVRRAIAEGHAIGSHSFSHPHPAHTPLPQLAHEYAEGRSAVAAVAGPDLRLFRPPHGHLSVRSAVMVRRQGLSPWLWTVDPEDWRPGVSTAEIVAGASAAASRDVVLLHDWVEQPWGPKALDRSSTIAALPEIVDAVVGRGLRFVTLPA
jgi:peptidoglycan-N-acetylglucosamine deacetylase